MRRITILSILIFINSMQVYAGKSELLIPRSYPEKCKYYLIKSKSNSEILRVTSKQVCPKNKFYSGVGFSITDIDCNSRKYKEIGYGDDLISNIKNYSSARWSSLVRGSSKFDLVNFVCK